MNRSDIIASLFKGKSFNDCIGRMEPADLREDLRQEVILKVCELPAQKIEGLHSRGELEFYTARIIINEMRNRHNGFSKKFLTRHQELNGHEVADHSDIEERKTKELIEQLAIEEISRLEKTDWYAHELIKLYQEHGTFRAIQTLTGIPYVSCYKTIKKALAEVRRRSIDPAARPVNQTQMIRG